jgi:hypothetical protein
MLCSALGSAAALAADWQGEEVQRDGVLTIVNPENPSGGAVEIELEELWRVGGDDEDVLFGVIAQLVVDDAGDVYLLDGQLSEVQVFCLTREGQEFGSFVIGLAR